jgi:N-acyl-D-aspartate/D-glutamate deacylase
MLDLVIRNAQIIDGTGRAGFPGDVGIEGGRIRAIGRVTESARRTIDAGGHVVSPGFVDVHTHYDAQVFWDPTVSPYCFHGVTTIWCGNCGFSIAPLSKEAAPYLLTMLARVEGMPVNSLQAGVPWDWESFGDYLGKLDGRLGVNAGFMAGHSALRRVVMGERAIGHPATREELEKMKRLLAKSEPQSGLFELWELGLLHESMEAVIWDNPRVHALFTPAELGEAHRRLEELGYFQSRA